MSEICDTCNKECSFESGYILNTSQVITKKAYWYNAFSNPWKDLKNTNPRGDIIKNLVNNQIEAGETGWLICNECSSLFEFDKDYAQNLAKIQRLMGGAMPVVSEDEISKSEVVQVAASGWEQAFGYWPKAIKREVLSENIFVFLINNPFLEIYGEKVLLEEIQKSINGESIKLVQEYLWNKSNKKFSLDADKNSISDELVININSFIMDNFPEDNEVNFHYAFIKELPFAILVGNKKNLSNESLIKLNHDSNTNALFEENDSNDSVETMNTEVQAAQKLNLSGPNSLETTPVTPSDRIEPDAINIYDEIEHITKYLNLFNQGYYKEISKYITDQIDNFLLDIYSNLKTINDKNFHISSEVIEINTNIMSSMLDVIIGYINEQTKEINRTEGEDKTYSIEMLKHHLYRIANQVDFLTKFEIRNNETIRFEKNKKIIFDYINKLNVIRLIYNQEGEIQIRKDRLEETLQTNKEEFNKLNHDGYGKKKISKANRKLQLIKMWPFYLSKEAKEKNIKNQKDLLSKLKNDLKLEKEEKINELKKVISAQENRLKIINFGRPVTIPLGNKEIPFNK